MHDYMILVKVFLLLAGFATQVTRQTHIEKVNLQQDTFPVPASGHKTLFYLQRSLDFNSIIYEMNLDDKGKPDLVSPVNIYWLNHATGEHSPLSAAQRKWAYGVRSTLVS